MRTRDDMVRQEVVHNCSALISTLLGGANMPFKGAADLPALCEQALELSVPLLDYEAAAEENGWRRVHDDSGDYWRSTDSATGAEDEADTAEAACEIAMCEPHEREIFEHWIVTDWLAEKLEAKGERVDRDFAGLCVWGRTTTGQRIAMDSVIIAVHREACASYLREFHGEPRDGYQRLDFVTPDGSDEPVRVYAYDDPAAAYLTKIAVMAGWKLA